MKTLSKIIYGATSLAVLAGVVTVMVPPVSGPSINLTADWEIHTIVAGVAGTGQPDGADGVFLSDVDGDGLKDIVTGYEQGLRLTLSFNPGPSLVESPWPTVTLPNAGNLCSAEDVVIGDVDGDGAKDIVAACETGTVRVSIFFAPSLPNTRSELLNPANWTQVDIAASAGNRSMRAQIVNIADTAAMEIVVGGKESSGPCVAAQIGYYSNATPTNQASWASATFNSMRAVGWVMNMYVQDLNNDTFPDVIYSDREPIDCPTPGGTNQGITLLISNGATPVPSFTPTVFLSGEGDHKWFTLDDWDADGDLDIVDCRSNGVLNTSQILINNSNFSSLTPIAVTQPTNVGQCQHATVTDVDNNGKKDLAFSYSNAAAFSGLAYLLQKGTPLSPNFSRGEVSGILHATNDTKFDNLEHEDVDGDGDKDFVTTEQHLPAGTGPGLGSVYAENPFIKFTPPPVPPAVTCTLLTAASNTTDATSFQTASVSPSGNAVIYAAVQTAQGAGPVAPTINGAAMGLTWVQERTVTFSTRRLTVLRSMAASPTPGQITFDFGVQSQTSAIWQIIQCTGVDTGGTNGSAATPQSVSATVAAGTTLSTTLAAIGDSDNRTLTWVGLDIASSVSPDADFVEISDATVAAGASTLESQQALNQTVTTPTFASSNAGAISIEVKIAP